MIPKIYIYLKHGDKLNLKCTFFLQKRFLLKLSITLVFNCILVTSKNCDICSVCSTVDVLVPARTRTEIKLVSATFTSLVSTQYFQKAIKVQSIK